MSDELHKFLKSVQLMRINEPDEKRQAIFDKTIADVSNHIAAKARADSTPVTKEKAA